MYSDAGIALYFQQDNQRIARCDYCWGWFIPKTKKATRYCDRVTDGFPCKQRGIRFKRNLTEETAWQGMVAGNFAFDAETHYPETIQVLDLGAEKPEWELHTADDLLREDQEGHQSLREKYGRR